MQPVMSGYVTMVMVKKRQHVSVSNVKHICADSVFLSTMYRKQLCTENSYVQKSAMYRNQLCTENSYVQKTAMYRKQPHFIVIGESTRKLNCT